MPDDGNEDLFKLSISLMSGERRVEACDAHSQLPPRVHVNFLIPRLKEIELWLEGWLISQVNMPESA